MPTMIVVTSPTSMIGSQLLATLRAANAPLRVIARDPSKLPPGLEIVEGSHGDAATVAKAFAGADTVFWLTPPNPRAPSLAAGYLDFTAPAAAAFREHGVKRVVAVSALGRGRSTNAGYVTASLASDDQFAATGVALRALCMPSFMDNMLRQIEPLKARGVFVSTIRPDLELPTVATRDIAAVAAQLLLDPSWTGSAEVPVLGPEDLSHDDQARIMTEVLGTPIRYEQVSLDQMKARMLERGMSEAMAQGRVDMMAAKDAGLDNGVERDPAFPTPTTFRQWCEQVLKPALT